MLSINNVNKSFHTSEIETKALSDISFNIEEGEFVAFSGQSGSGKTTLLNVIGLLENFNSGSYLIDGINIEKLSDRDRSKFRLETIGFIFQGFNLLPELSIFSNVELPLRLRGFSSGERKRRVEKVLDIVGLLSRQKHYPSQLSGGQQQRIAIARALAGSPRVLLADEPTGNLDSKMSEQIFKLLEYINDQKTTILMVTHDDDHANRAKRKISIADGRVAADTVLKKL